MNDRAAQLANSFARAQQLTKVVATSEFDKYAKNLNEGGFIDSNILSENYAPQEMLQYNPNAPQDSYSMTSGGYDAHVELKNMSQNTSKPIRNNIGLPKQILEEIQNNPLNGISSDPTMDAFTNQLTSVTNLMPQSSQQRKPSITEQFQTSHQQPMNNGGGGSFDYEMLKMIIEGVVKKYIEPLKESLLTENANMGSNASLKMMKIGKNFQFMDNSGNLYEADLKYKGNVKDMKKKPVK